VDTQDEQASQLAALVEAAFPVAEPSGPELPRDDADFIVTKEHRRFTEFVTAVRRDRYITSACATARPASAKPSPPAVTPAGMSWNPSYGHPPATSPRAATGPTGTPCFTPRLSPPPHE